MPGAGGREREETLGGGGEEPLGRDGRREGVPWGREGGKEGVPWGRGGEPFMGGGGGDQGRGGTARQGPTPNWKRKGQPPLRKLPTPSQRSKANLHARAHFSSLFFCTSRNENTPHTHSAENKSRASSDQNSSLAQQISQIEAWAQDTTSISTDVSTPCGLTSA